MSAKRKPSKAMPVRRLCEIEMKRILLAATLTLATGHTWAWSGSELLGQARAYQRCQIEKRCTDGDMASAWIYLGFVGGATLTLAELVPKLRWESGKWIPQGICLPTAGTTEQYAEVVKQHLEQNPSQLHRPAQVLVREAIQQAFPCR